MRIKNIGINHFRGIPHLEIEDFGRVNLFLGRNNCGKTAVLEAIFMLLGISNPQLSLKINSFRDLPFNDVDDFRYIFYNLDFNNVALLKGDFNEHPHSRELTIRPLHDISTGEQDIRQFEQDFGSFTPNTTENITRIKGLKHEFAIKKEGKSSAYHSAVTIDGGRLMVDQANNYRESINGVFLRPGINEKSTVPRLEKLIKAKQQDKVISVLQKVDPRINNVTVFSNGRIFFDLEGFRHLVPSNIAGDGIRRLLSLITTILESSKGIVLVDEIENGLHYSVHQKLWDAIIAASQTMDVQLFITTHNIESLQYLEKALKASDNSEFREEIGAYTIRALNDGSFKAYKYTYSEFAYAMQQENEIR